MPDQTLCRAIHRARKLDRGKNLRHRAAPELLTRNLTFLTFIFTQNTVQQEGFVEVSFFSGGLFFHQYILLWCASFRSYFFNYFTLWYAGPVFSLWFRTCFLIKSLRKNDTLFHQLYWNICEIFEAITVVFFWSLPSNHLISSPFSHKIIFSSEKP